MVNANEFAPKAALATKPGHQATKGDQFTSFNVDDFDIPKGRDEVWRFVSLRQLRGLHNGKFPDVVAQKVEVTTPAGVSTETVAPNDERLGTAGAPADRVGAQAWTSMPEAQIVTVDADAAPEEAVTITITGAGDDVTSFGATSIQVGHHAKATIVLKYVGTGTHADNVEFIIGEGANVTVVVDADWDNGAVHLSNQMISMGRDATLRHSVATFGGEVVRVVPRVVFSEPGADAELLGVYFADQGQYFENRLLVDHKVANCRSRVLYKGAVQGTPDNVARTCWVGDVLIRANAHNTDTYETNANLILTEGGRADAIPNLEIETGQIAGAGHAATVGRFDDEQLFYLMARGIPEPEARRLIIHGFFSEVISRIPVESLREELEARVSYELEKINV